jgi:hypothetical protein
MRAIDSVDLGPGDIAIQEQPGHIEIRVDIRIKRLRIDSDDGLPFVPGDTEIAARGSVGS